MVPPARLRALNDAPVRPDGRWVLYWMEAARRTGFNFALEHAAELARTLDRPLVVLEPLWLDAPWASERLHAFVLDGMQANARALARRPVCYHPYVEPAPGAGRGLLHALAEGACAVVTDDRPVSFLDPRLEAAAAAWPVRLVAVDGCGLLPLAATDRAYPQAVHFRRRLQQALPSQLGAFPAADPLRAGLPRPVALPAAIRERWPAATPDVLAGRTLGRLPVDHAVGRAEARGGSGEAQRRVRAFVADGLARYPEGMRHPDEAGTSGLSPYLHFGHLSAHALFEAVAAAEGWTPEDLGPARGQREGFWGMSAAAEAFLDQAVVWRELGRHWCRHRGDAASFDGVPAWARESLLAHRADPRPARYDLQALEAARTGDPVWNAAQRELLRTGRIHGQLRMLWGKRVIEWTRDPRDAFRILVHLNDRWALDGRDPNGWAGIGWVFGRFDRPWPERAVFGRVRAMSSERTRKKLRMERYLSRYSS